ncbi:hypothetical protein M0R72_18720 [Candidatus Pacearchaeota archaeon]|jgi:hypothetical protein|nr:hypothetical protein [Candidatus Pacearchaeota archaeon]
MRLISLILIGFLCMGLSGAVRSEINASVASWDGSANVTWFALNTAGHYLDIAEDGRQVLIINTTNTISAYVQNITIPAGIFWREGLGDKLFQLATNQTYILGPFESSRFKQANETVLLDTNETRGSVALVLLPR